MVKVSILIPCYNNAEWVAPAIESALGQTHQPVEVIAYDDGSSDGSTEVMQSFGDRIRWESGPNRGGNHARNRLLEMATGEWVQFLDADDALAPSKVADQLALAEDGVDAIYGCVTLQFWKGDAIDREEIVRPDSRLDQYGQWISWHLAHTGAVLWRAESLRRIGGWNEAYPCCQDNEVCLRALKGGLVFKHSPDAGSLYRMWSGSTVSHKDPKRLLDTKTNLLEEMLDWLQKEDLYKDIHRDLAGLACFQMARSYAGHDIAKATAYWKTTSARGMMKLDPAIAPLAYRCLYRIFGFRTAESVAALLRR
jgi:glycosyltransferase involved in cell wall biosynthesis